MIYLYIFCMTVARGYVFICMYVCMYLCFVNNALVGDWYCCGSIDNDVGTGRGHWFCCSIFRTVWYTHWYAHAFVSLSYNIHKYIYIWERHITLTQHITTRLLFVFSFYSIFDSFLFSRVACLIQFWLWVASFSSRCLWLDIEYLLYIYYI